jgi:plastocyanin
MYYSSNIIKIEWNNKENIMKTNLLKISAFVIFAVVLAACAPQAATSSSGSSNTRSATVVSNNPAPISGVDLTSSTNVDINIKGFAFDPANITIKVGTQVKWTNLDNAPHTVTSDPGQELSSPMLSNGDTYTHVFNQAGTFAYHCGNHPSMVATITVVP